MELMAFMALAFSIFAVYAALVAIRRVNQLVDFVHAAKDQVTGVYNDKVPCDVCEGDMASCWKCGGEGVIDPADVE